MDMAYTLQVGRDAMKERLAFVVRSVAQLADKLEAFAMGSKNVADTYQGQAARNNDILDLFGSEADLEKTIDKQIADKNYPKLLELWVKGLDLDWNRLYVNNKPRRMSLPSYPFAQERYWIDQPALSPSAYQISEGEIKVEAAKVVEEKPQKMYFFPRWKESPLAESDKNTCRKRPGACFRYNRQIVPGIEKKRWKKA
ncbi:MAG: hypothetical protein HC896_03025 [Bacteroidales bacterium]|nr:hypothetical protein [Bacteroidales bacterium]